MKRSVIGVDYLGDALVFIYHTVNVQFCSSELICQTPLCEELEDMYYPSRELIRISDYQSDLKLCKLKRSAWVTQTEKGDNSKPSKDAVKKVFSATIMFWRKIMSRHWGIKGQIFITNLLLFQSTSQRFHGYVSHGSLTGIDHRSMPMAVDSVDWNL